VATQSRSDLVPPPVVESRGLYPVINTVKPLERLQQTHFCALRIAIFEVCTT
jgi:hypothetical protein